MAEFEEIQKVWATTLGISKEVINSESNFFTLGGDSLHAVKIVQSLRTKYPNLQISQAYEYPVLQDFVSSLGGNASKENPIDFKKETELELKLDASLLSTQSKTYKLALVTGVTGYYGPALLLHLLTFSSQKLVIIIRAADNEAAKKKFNDTIDKNGFASFFQMASEERLQILAGDITLPGFGLEEAEYKRLCLEVDAVYHAACDTHQLKTYAQLKGSNVVMVKNVIEFATTDKLKFLEYISTVALYDSVFTPGGYGPFIANDEYLPDKVNPLRMLNGYLQTKYVGEELVQKAYEAGVPGAIFRLGQVGCHEILPIVNKESGLGSFLRTCKNLVKYPNVTCKFPFLVLDSAAKIVVDKSRGMLKKNQKRVFHLVEIEITLAEFFKADKSPRKYEAVTLAAWEREFNSQCQWEGKEDICTLLFLNNLKAKMDKKKYAGGLTKRTISLVYTPANSNPIVYRNEALANYIPTLFEEIDKY